MRKDIFKEYAENSPMAALDADLNYIYVSRQWQDYTGVSWDEAIGKNVLSVIPDSMAPECLKTGKTVVHTVFPESPVKGKIPTMTIYTPRRDSSGKVCGVFLSVLAEGVFGIREINRQISQLTSEVEYYKEELSHERGARYSLSSIIGNSPAMLRMKSEISIAARSNSSVLIEGETGTGKEMVAHAIHSLSSRSLQKFVTVNCSAIPAELMESEFFGYEPGSFTGALSRGKIGKFELANNGSIFLDEVNLLTPTIQPKFLRVLQEMEIDPVGGKSPRKIDVRIISASNIPLEKLIAEGKFRADLYYRLNVIKITAPPLRTIKEDIPSLTANLIERLNKEMGTSIVGVEPSVIELFYQYNWPGNVRELHNVIESAINVTTGRILTPSDFERLRERITFSSHLADPANMDYNLREAKHRFEKELIERALKQSGGNRAKAADLLCISRTVLYKKLEQYGIR